MPPSDHALPEDLPNDLPETLDLIAQLVASVSDRMDGLAELAELQTTFAPLQSEVLKRILATQEQLLARTAHLDRPAVTAEQVATATALSVRETLLPDMARLVRVLERLTDKESPRDARRLDEGMGPRGRWHTHPLAVVLGIPLVLLLVLGLTVPRAVAQTQVICEATGGTWYQETEQYAASCLFWAEPRDDAHGS